MERHDRLALLGISLAAAALILAHCDPANSATLRSYTPGGAPCAGACGYDWARERFHIPEGVAERMVIPEGSIVTQMSYAKGGVPYTFSESAVLSEDEPGQGYYFTVEGVVYMMVQLDACANWAVMMPPATGVSYGTPEDDYSPSQEWENYSGGYGSGGWGEGNGDDWDEGGGGCRDCGHGGTDTPPVEPPVEPPPTPVNLPGSCILSLSGLALLYNIGKRKRHGNG